MKTTHKIIDEMIFIYQTDLKQIHTELDLLKREMEDRYLKAGVITEKPPTNTALGGLFTQHSKTVQSLQDLKNRLPDV